MATYLYDCDMGQGSVEAETLEEAQREAVLDAGRNAEVRNVHLAIPTELSFRRAMGGN